MFSFQSLPTLSSLSPSFFHTNRQLTRFDSSSELKSIADQLKLLKLKNDEINLDVNRDSGDTAYLKWQYLSQLITKLDADIASFNNDAKLSSDNEEKQAMIVLAQSLKVTIETVLANADQMREFNKVRAGKDMLTKSAQTAVQVAQYGMSAMSSFAGFAKAMAYGAETAESNVEEAPKETRTVELLREFSKKVTDTITNLNVVLEIARKAEAEKSVEPTSPIDEMKSSAATEEESPGEIISLRPGSRGPGG